MLEVKELCFSYGRQTVFREVSFHLEPGQCLVVSGANGCGKSTLVSLLAGALKPLSGQIIKGSAAIALVPQENGIFTDMTVEENLRFFALLGGVKMPEKLYFGLDEFRKTRAENLSGGFRKRLGIACAMISQPDILILDEPSSGLDLCWRDQVKELILQLKEQHRSVILVSHDPEEFESLWDQLLLMRGSSCRLMKRGEEKESIRQILRNWIGSHADPQQ